MTRGGDHFVFAKIGAARPARVADFLLAISAVGRSMALGRSSCSQLPGRCTSAPAASERAGGLYVMLSLRHFRLARSWSLSLGAGEPRRARANRHEHDPRRRPFRFRKNRRCSTGASRRFPFSNFRCGPIDGARAVELFAATGSLHIGAGRERTGRGALRHALASTFPAGAIVVFIPWCWGAETRAGESTQSMTRGGDHFVFAQIGAARPARVADFRFSNFRCGPHRWRSGGRAVRSYRVAAHRRRPRANGPGGSTSCSRFDISGWRDRGLYPLVLGRRDARGQINTEHDPRRRPFRFRTNRRCSTGASRRFPF